MSGVPNPFKMGQIWIESILGRGGGRVKKINLWSLRLLKLLTDSYYNMHIHIYSYYPLGKLIFIHYKYGWNRVFYPFLFLSISTDLYLTRSAHLSPLDIDMVAWLWLCGKNLNFYTNNYVELSASLLLFFGVFFNNYRNIILMLDSLFVVEMIQGNKKPRELGD